MSSLVGAAVSATSTASAGQHLGALREHGRQFFSRLRSTDAAGRRNRYSLLAARQQLLASIIARRDRPTLSDVSCGGATTRRFFNTKYPTLSPQLAALNAKIGLVTIRVNNRGMFAGLGLVDSCIAAGARMAYSGTPCTDQFRRRFSPAQINTVEPRIDAALRAVIQRAPNATVAVLPYPAVYPATVVTCPQLAIAPGDFPFLHSAFKQQNSVIGRAARKNRVLFVGEIATQSRGYAACQPPGR